MTLDTNKLRQKCPESSVTATILLRFISFPGTSSTKEKDRQNSPIYNRIVKNLSIAYVHIHTLLLTFLAKGQLISKGLFVILKFFQKTNETMQS